MGGGGGGGGGVGGGSSKSTELLLKSGENFDCVSSVHFLIKGPFLLFFASQGEPTVTVSKRKLHSEPTLLTTKPT